VGQQERARLESAGSGRPQQRRTLGVLRAVNERAVPQEEVNN
jgi:hypothetical protein